MRVRVRLWGALERYRPVDAAPGRGFEIEVEQGLTVEGLARTLGIPVGLMRICAVGGALVARDTVLREGDDVSLLPAASGGATTLEDHEGGGV